MFTANTQRIKHILGSFSMYFGCHWYNFPGMQVKTENDLGRFSLEYPSSYSDDGRPKRDSNYFAIIFKMPEKGIQVNNPDPNIQNSQPVTMYFTPAFIRIFIFSPKDFTAKPLIEKYIQAKKGETGYNLLARSQVTVSGITAEFAHVTDSFMVPVRVALGEQPLKHYLWAYFDYKGLIWQIECESDSEELQHAQADFDHVIQTFKISAVQL